jgi:hypothetical protein
LFGVYFEVFRTFEKLDNPAGSIRHEVLLFVPQLWSFVQNIRIPLDLMPAVSPKRVLLLKKSPHRSVPMTVSALVQRKFEIEMTFLKLLASLFEEHWLRLLMRMPPIGYPIPNLLKINEQSVKN